MNILPPNFAENAFKEYCRSLTGVEPKVLRPRSNADALFHSIAHKLNAVGDLEDRQRDDETAALIRILRDETQSADVHARCVAIVGAAS